MTAKIVRLYGGVVKRLTGQLSPERKHRRTSVHQTHRSVDSLTKLRLAEQRSRGAGKPAMKSDFACWSGDCAHNVLGFPRSGKWIVRFNSGAAVYDPEF